VIKSWAVATARLLDALQKPEDACGLAETVLTIALAEYPRLDLGQQLSRFDQFSEEVRALMDAEAAARQRTEQTSAPESVASQAAREVAALNTILFERHGFTGDTDEYYNPENSYLNCVLARRRGIPITLAIIYIEVARRAGIPVEGVGFPGHFLVKHTGVVPALLIDPFNHGALLSTEDCHTLLRSLHGPAAAFFPQMLATTSRRDIVIRVVRNLKAAYLRVEDFERALGAADCLVQISPDDPTEWRDRGLVKLRLEDTRGALADLARYVEMVPSGPETREVEEAVASLRAMLARMN
jgi:regulator of sirC expression with transglutaminase-like and TPR domain